MDTFTDKPHHVHGHRIAQSMIAGSVRRQLATIRNEGEVVWKTLQSLKFSWGQATHVHSGTFGKRQGDYTARGGILPRRPFARAGQGSADFGHEMPVPVVSFLIADRRTSTVQRRGYYCGPYATPYFFRFDFNAASNAGFN